MNYYSIVKGKFFIKAQILLDLYNKWCYNINKKRPLTNVQFHHFCRVFFSPSHYRNYHGIIYIGITKDILKHLPNLELKSETRTTKNYYEIKKIRK